MIIQLNDIIFQPDSTQIVSRLMQIRDYIKQATSMMDGLKRSIDPVRINFIVNSSRIHASILKHAKQMIWLTIK